MPFVANKNELIFQFLFAFDDVFKEAKRERNNNQNNGGQKGELEHRIRNTAWGDKE